MALNFLTNLSYAVFLTTLLFPTSLSLPKSTGVVCNLSISNLSTLLFKLLKSFGILSNLSISILSTFDLKVVKSTFLAKSDVSTSVVFLSQVFLIRQI